MAHPSELTWVEFELSDGFKASYAIDGQEVKMMVDDDQIPDGLTVRQRLDQCYEYFFGNIYKTLPP